MALEIERRWLIDLDKVPSGLISNENTVYIRQFYDKDKVRFRYQKNRTDNNVTCFKTIKTGEGLVRTENENIISVEIFLQKYEESSAPEMVIKERVKIPFHDVIIELDRFYYLGDLVIAEIEFPDEVSANNFTNIPDWFGKEITNEKGLSNYDLFVKINKE
ncbi:putative CYTH-like phosphatase [Aeromonas phage AerS_266]|nr:putative CYTH-like phosphatase [Aeromonas phage AerS_266]